MITDSKHSGEKDPFHSKGSLLVAEPFVSESIFFRSVILLFEQNRYISVGIILNKPSPLKLAEAMPGVNVPPDIPIFRGGPVSPERLFYVHRLGRVISNAIPINDDLWIDGDFDQIVAYLQSGNPVSGTISFFLGYAGWELSELSREIVAGTWAVTYGQENDLLQAAKGEAFWKDSVKRLGAPFGEWLTYPRLSYLN